MLTYLKHMALAAAAALCAAPAAQAADQNLNKISATQDESMRIVKAVASVRPDIVIASQAD